MSTEGLAHGLRRPLPRGWRRGNEELVRELMFRDFDEALRFVETVGAAAEDHLRRPDMCIVDFNRVRLRISNPRHAGLTDAELRLLEKVEAVLSASGGSGTGAPASVPEELALQRSREPANTGEIDGT